ncbi:hypothetical protein [Streptomyces sp. NBC_01465]|uniref:hypothetical protein n=1 Tax=Streptomyces sp. NBC_01465 TaxID=2903878 RepID=UPI002E35FDD3|nr:hypothetical protein [Streptomyces sp. NBC_01465]
MRLELAGGVVASGRHAWLSGTFGPVRLVDEADGVAGAAVALGPAEANDAQARDAVAELERIVAAGGPVAAGAGIDLGGEFTSARLAGAGGDQRDAVLAALKVLGAEGAGRLGDQARVLVALFGPSATKRVGAAAGRAVAEGRWAALHLACAASDVLGPEQLELILALEAPAGIDVMSGGLPSALAAHLRQVCEPVPPARRPALLVDLWAQVLGLHAQLARRRRLLATQGRQDRLDELRARRSALEDDEVVSQLRYALNGREPSLADAARWTAPDHHWWFLLNRMVQDARAATALLRTAVAVSDHGLSEGLRLSHAVLAAVDADFNDVQAAQSARRIPGLTGLPARPGSHVRDIHRRFHKVGPDDAKLHDYVMPRLARAREYALLVTEEVTNLLDEMHPVVPAEALRGWAAAQLQTWRREVGYTSVRPPSAWDANPPWVRGTLGLTDTLAERLRTLPDRPPAEVEVVGDLLWYAEMADALSQLYGHEAAQDGLRGLPWLAYDPAPAPADPLTPRLESITLAVAGAAQLVALGAHPAKGVRTWPELTGSLRAGIDIATALSGEFDVPVPVADLDRTVVPGTRARFQVARTAHTLAEWSAYMGNCIAGADYVERAVKGHCVLAALYDDHGRILANAELRPTRATDRGWRVNELAARFNDQPDAALARSFRSWVATIPGAEAPPSDEPSADETVPGRRARQRVSPHLFETVGPALVEQLEGARHHQVTDDALSTFAVLANTAPHAAPTRLRRLPPLSLATACQQALAQGKLDLPHLWTATSVRPLATAVDALDPALRRRFEQLTLLTSDAPLPKSLRRLVKLPTVATAYATDLMSLRVRAALGRLMHDGDAVLARAMAGHTTVPLLCAAAVTVNCRTPTTELTQVTPPRTVTVPGFPSTDLADAEGPWQQALPAARELGADTTVWWDHIAEHGLRIPTAWLGAGGWPALWSRAHRRSSPDGERALPIGRDRSPAD